MPRRDWAGDVETPTYRVGARYADTRPTGREHQTSGSRRQELVSPVPPAMPQPSDNPRPDWWRRLILIFTIATFMGTLPMLWGVVKAATRSVMVGLKDFDKELDALRDPASARAVPTQEPAAAPAVVSEAAPVVKESTPPNPARSISSKRGRVSSPATASTRGNSEAAATAPATGSKAGAYRCMVIVPNGSAAEGAPAPANTGKSDDIPVCSPEILRSLGMKLD